MSAKPAANFQQDPDGSWTPAQPLGWAEEHTRLERFVFWLRGVGHCGKPGRRAPR